MATQQHQHHDNNNNKANIRAQFVKAMNEATQRAEEANRQTALMTRLLESAKPVKTAFVRRSTTTTTTSSINGGEKERNLQNYNYQYGYYDYQYNNYYQNDDANQAQQQEEEAADEDGDDVFADYGGLNLTQYALKYLGCQNIHTFSDDMAMDENEYGSLIMNRFVVFRLCPKEKCSNYNAMGCEYNYGEYTMPMDDYLTIMNTYHISQYQQYCQTCHYCMTGEGSYYNAQQQGDNQQRDLANYYYGNNNYKGGGGGGAQYTSYNYNSNNNQNKNNQYQNNGNDDQQNAAADDYANDDQYNNQQNGDDAAAAAGDDNVDAANGDDDAAAGDDGVYNATESVTCAYADVCAAYTEACDEEMFTDNNYMTYAQNYAQYFECSEFDVGGSVSYLGPHCRSDGFTIGIGIYEDQYCSNYIGDMVDMEEVTGTSIDDEYLSPYYPKQCISCQASESYDLMTDDEMQNENEAENNGIYEVCGYLYEQAAKCNIHLTGDKGYEGAYQQEANERDVCNFVASLIENNYDEYGEVYLESPEWEISKWKSINAYKQDMQAVSSVQILGLVFSVGLVVGLVAYSVYLRQKLITRRVPWKFGFAGNKTVDAPINKANSGIMMQRSLSGLEPSASGSSYA